MDSIISLSSTTDSELLNCFNDGFFNLIHRSVTLKELTLSNSQSAVNLKRSFGLRRKGKLIGILLAGQAIQQNGTLYNYNAGTAILPQYQNQGLGSRLMKAWISDNPRGNFILEVLTNNDPAISLYKKFGFTINRQLLTLQYKNETPKLTKSHLSFRLLENVPTSTVNRSFCTQLSLKRNPKILGGITNNKVIGHGVLEDANILELFGEQLTPLLLRLIVMARSHTILASRFDSSYKPAINALLSTGFTQLRCQFEMVFTP